jgi:hypothetical protein
MELRWYRHEQATVVAALQAGERPDMVTSRGVGVLDQLVALHRELGVFIALDQLPLARQRAGLADSLLLHTLAVLPFLAQPALGTAAHALFQEPAILLQLGWAPMQIRQGSNHRHRHPAGRQAGSLPCHPDVLRDTLRRVEIADWEQAQRAGVGALYTHRLVRGGVYAIDGSSIGPDLRLVCLVAVSGRRPLIVAWRLLSGAASEKGKEAHVTRSLVEQVLAVGGAGSIKLLLADALYADGPLLAWLKYEHQIAALIRLAPQRELYADLQRLTATGTLPWEPHQHLRVVQGHKQLVQVEVAGGDDFPSWDSYQQAAAKYGDTDATVWGGLWRELDAAGQPKEPAVGLVSTRNWARVWGAFEAYRDRWQIEDDTYRELKEGWAMERGRWGRDAGAAHGRVSLTCLAYNTVAIYRSRAGEQLAALGIRRLQRVYTPQLGLAPVVVYLGECYAVLALEDLLELLGRPVRTSLLPASTRPQPEEPP